MLALRKTNSRLLRALFYLARPLVAMRMPIRLRPLLLKFLQPCDANVLQESRAFEMCFESARQAWRSSAKGVMTDAEIYAVPWGFSLEEVRVPVALWHGSKDRTFATRLAKDVATRLPNCQFRVIEGAGHYSLPIRHMHEILKDLLGDRALRRRCFRSRPLTKTSRAEPDPPFFCTPAWHGANFTVEDFTSGITQDQPARRQSSIGEPFDERVHELVADWGAEKSPELIEELIITALKMARDKMGTGDLKLMSRSLKEMRYAAKVFSAYRAFRKVCVFGSARTPPSEAQYAVAEEFAREMVAQNYMVITGGGDGIMGAAQKGAGREHGFGLNIRLPFEQRANPIIEGDPKLINFNYFFTRKLNFVKETHAFALFPAASARWMKGSKS
jgi:Predicted Rossmann fold nucleotide-binding protein